MEYSLIANDRDLESCLENWNRLERIAVDFECEFNLHIYGEHLCLIQVFDGERFYIIDPRSNGITKESLISFFQSPVRKVWFDCQSDNSLVFKKYGTAISNILDVRVYALSLGYKTNLISLEKEFLGLETDIEPSMKKKLQQTNWVRRPLSDVQIEYVLSDVAHLFELEDVLEKRVEEAGLMKQCLNALSSRAKPAVPRPGWVTLGNWKAMTKAQRSNVKQYYIARDVVAKRFNVPSFNVLDKHLLLSFALSCPRTEEDVIAFTAKANPRFQSQLKECFIKAYRIIRQTQEG